MRMRLTPSSARRTTTLSVIEKLVPRGVFTSHTSSAAIFRTIEKFQPTLLVDEADTNYFAQAGYDRR